MHYQTPRFASAAALMFALAAGCGDLADQDTRPPVLATFQGSLRLASPTSAPQGNIRLALLWHVPSYEQPSDLCDSLDPNLPYMHAQPSARGPEQRFLLGSLQQAVDITPRFPSAFKLEVTAPPPAEAMYEQEGGVRIAEGELVVYRDGNGNGQLDPRTNDAGSPDEVLSTELGYFGLQSDDPATTTRPWAYEVWYLDRAHKFSDLLDLHSGYNVLSYKEYGAKPANEIDLELFPTPALQSQLCTDECVILDAPPFACPANPAADLPRPPATAVSGYLQTGKGWIWQDGPDSFVFESKHCSQTGGSRYEFRWSRTYVDGCLRRRSTDCSYGPEAQPSPSWPCESYYDFSLRGM